MSTLPNTCIYQTVEGFKMPKDFPPDRFLSCLKYQPKKDDLFLVSYPRCGSTWTQQIIYLIYHKGEPPSSGADALKKMPFLEMTGAEAAEQLEPPVIIKIHLPFDWAPYSPDAKYIYLARNPKDCLTSMYHFINSTIPHKAQISPDEFFELFINGELPFGNYFDHLMSWYEHRNDSNVLFMTYEEIKADLRGAVAKLANFLGEEYAGVASDEEVMQKIEKHSGIGFLKKQYEWKLMQNTEGSEEVKDSLPGGVKEVLANRKKMPELIRKGIVGDWRNHLSEEQSRKIAEVFCEKTQGTDLPKLWKDAM